MCTGLVFIHILLSVKEADNVIFFKDRSSCFARYDYLPHYAVYCVYIFFCAEMYRVIRSFHVTIWSGTKKNYYLRKYLDSSVIWWAFHVFCFEGTKLFVPSRARMCTCCYDDQWNVDSVRNRPCQFQGLLQAVITCSSKVTILKMMVVSTWNNRIQFAWCYQFWYDRGTCFWPLENVV